MLKFWKELIEALIGDLEALNHKLIKERRSLFFGTSSLWKIKPTENSIWYSDCNRGARAYAFFGTSSLRKIKPTENSIIYSDSKGGARAYAFFGTSSLLKIKPTENSRWIDIWKECVWYVCERRFIYHKTMGQDESMHIKILKKFHTVENMQNQHQFKRFMNARLMWPFSFLTELSLHTGQLFLKALTMLAQNTHMHRCPQPTTITVATATLHLTHRLFGNIWCWYCFGSSFCWWVGVTGGLWNDIHPPQLNGLVCIL